MKKRLLLLSCIAVIAAGFVLLQQVSAKKYIDLEDFDFHTITSKKVDPIDYRILVLKFDPMIYSGSVNGKSCKRKRASECARYDGNWAVYDFEQIENAYMADIRYMSHNTVNPKIVGTLDVTEHVRYLTNYEGKVERDGIVLTSTETGKPIRALDDATFIDMIEKGPHLDKKTNPNGYVLDRPGLLDYNFYIQQYGLDKRYEKGEFDVVWILSGPFTGAYESLMYGRGGYDVNAGYIQSDTSSPFMFLAVNYSRADTQLECLGHATESIMTRVFAGDHYSEPTFLGDIYDANRTVKVNSKNYDTLNLWEKFVLVEYGNSEKGTGLSGPGAVHYVPNSKIDYDWSNYEDKVVSRWREWEYYPFFDEAPAPEVFSPNEYLSGPSDVGDINRSHKRWWFSLMPHVNGHTADGFSNNWWDYITGLRLTKKVTPSKSVYEYTVGDTITNVVFKATMSDGVIVRHPVKYIDQNISFSTSKLIGLDSDGVIYARKAGTTTMKYMLDGKSASVTIIIKEPPKEEKEKEEEESEDPTPLPDFESLEEDDTSTDDDTQEEEKNRDDEVGLPIIEPEPEKEEEPIKEEEPVEEKVVEEQTTKKKKKKNTDQKIVEAPTPDPVEKKDDTGNRENEEDVSVPQTEAEPNEMEQDDSNDNGGSNTGAIKVWSVGGDEPAICSDSSASDAAKKAAGCNKFGRQGLTNSVVGIINGILGVLGVVAVVGIVMGGIQYMTSTGVTEKIQTAKRTILYSSIGLAICILSLAIVNFVVNVVK